METPILYSSDENFEIGGCKVLHQSENDRACIIAAGITLFEALKAYEVLKSKGISVAVIDLYSIKPLNKSTIQSIAKKSENRIITVEDHYSAGGLGEAVAHAMGPESFSITMLAVTDLPRSGSP